METFAVILVVLCCAAALILAVIFTVKTIQKKPRKWVGLSALFCVAGVIVFSVIGSQVGLAGMTPEERAAYEMRLEQKAEERQAAKEAKAAEKEAQRLAKEQEKTEQEADKLAEKQRLAAEKAEAERKAAEEKAEQERLEWEAKEEADRMAAEEAERLEQERLTVTIDEIFSEYENNEARADSKYKGNRYRFSGEISEIDNDGIMNLLNFSGDVTLMLEVRINGESEYIIAGLKEEQTDAIKDYNVGDQITLDGECMSNSSWKKCEIIE